MVKKFEVEEIKSGVIETADVEKKEAVAVLTTDTKESVKETKTTGDNKIAATSTAAQSMQQEKNSLISNGLQFLQQKFSHQVEWMSEIKDTFIEELKSLSQAISGRYTVTPTNVAMKYECLAASSLNVKDSATPVNLDQKVTLSDDDKKFLVSNFSSQNNMLCLTVTQIGKIKRSMENIKKKLLYFLNDLDTERDILEKLMTEAITDITNSLSAEKATAEQRLRMLHKLMNATVSYADIVQMLNQNGSSVFEPNKESWLHYCINLFIAHKHTMPPSNPITELAQRIRTGSEALGHDIPYNHLIKTIVPTASCLWAEIFLQKISEILATNIPSAEMAERAVITALLGLVEEISDDMDERETLSRYVRITVEQKKLNTW